MASFLARTGGPLIETVRPAAVKKVSSPIKGSIFVKKKNAKIHRFT